MKTQMTNLETNEVLGGHNLTDALTILNALQPFLSAAGGFASALGAVGTALTGLLNALPKSK
ncbi:hypothetical protein CS022_08145 [Veronia nyctiphanis]|uniref:Uncharacterized protein n=1 Tax=Veronia nyctiphanis TaxID=1278244 RepID=A0A4Q0YXB3_9GAMM|nr:hypothetical protein [Veronia nyctiphanis]RXJ73701.1 hypothetical protein CS022_08145 [Veronia nyctiphanis]